MNQEILHKIVTMTDADVQKSGLFQDRAELMEQVYDLMDDIIIYQRDIVEFNRTFDAGSDIGPIDTARHHKHEKMMTDMRMMNRICDKMGLDPLFTSPLDDPSKRRLCALEAFAFLKEILEELR